MRKINAQCCHLLYVVDPVQNQVPLIKSPLLWMRRVYYYLFAVGESHNCITADDSNLRDAIFHRAEEVVPDIGLGQNELLPGNPE